MTLLDFYITLAVALTPVVAIALLLYIDGRDRYGD